MSRKPHSSLPTTYNAMPTADGYDLRARNENEEQKKLRSMLFQSSFALVFLVVFLFVLHDISKDTTTSSAYKSTSETSVDTSTSSSTSKSSSKSFSSSSSKPNVVFVYVDDMGYGTIGYNQYDLYGTTPFIDSLIDDGMFLTNYYAQETCTPSRTALMTGRYPITTGTQYYLVQPALAWGLNLSEVLLPQVLRDEGGYATYGVGKWHIGHYTPDYLPTSRGFDQYLGYLNGESHYWSKLVNTNGYDFHDFVEMNNTCYFPYKNQTDETRYSTKLFTEKATSIIDKHDFDAKPMFLYLPYQAVHDPFDDVYDWFDGVNTSLVPTEVYNELTERLPGVTRQQYAFSLNLLDDALRNLYSALKKVDQADNTIFILASDNGGCYTAGGRNGNLRGCKGTLFEGGSKVNALIYAPTLLPEATRGTNYTNLFHVSDWFPTIMGLLDIDYSPGSANKLDGINHADSIRAWTTEKSADPHGSEGPRDSLIYNIYYNVNYEDFDNETAPFAIRNTRYKLVRTYVNNSYTIWYNFSSPLASDDDVSKGSCTPTSATASGDFTTMLFDLWSDPNETNDLYTSVSTTYLPEAYAAKLSLEEYFTNILPTIAYDAYGVKDDNASTFWLTEDSYILPYQTGSVNLNLCKPTTFFSGTSSE